MKRAIKWVYELSTLTKAISGIVGFAMLVSAALVWNNSRVIKKYVEGQTQEERVKEFDELRQGFLDLSLNIDLFSKSITDTLILLTSEVRKTNERLTRSEGTFNNLRNHMTLKAATKDDVLDVIRVFEDAEKKKNGINSLEIVPMPQLWPIQ